MAFDVSRDPRVSCWRRSDWEAVKLDVMYKALLAKFSQNNGLKELLKGTGERKLIEHSFYDSFWGDGGDNTGQNYLGKLLMQLRGELRGGKVGIPSVVYARNGGSPGTKPRQIVEQDASNSSSFGTGGGRGDTSTPPSLDDSRGGGRGDTSTPPSLDDSGGGGRGDTSTPPSLDDSGGGGRGDTSTPPSLDDSGGGGRGDDSHHVGPADAPPPNTHQQRNVLQPAKLHLGEKNPHTPQELSGGYRLGNASKGEGSQQGPNQNPTPLVPSTNAYQPVGSIVPNPPFQCQPSMSDQSQPYDGAVSSSDKDPSQTEVEDMEH